MFCFGLRKRIARLENEASRPRREKLLCEYRDFGGQASISLRSDGKFYWDSSRFGLCTTESEFRRIVIELKAAYADKQFELNRLKTGTPV